MHTHFMQDLPYNWGHFNSVNNLTTAERPLSNSCPLPGRESSLTTMLA